jgi:hypothetical protein
MSQSHVIKEISFKNPIMPRAAGGAGIGMGYMGYFMYNGTIYPTTSVNFQLRTQVQYYDHVVGLLDSGYSLFSDSKGSGGSASDKSQKRVYRFSPYLPTLSVSGVATDRGIFKKLLQDALEFKEASSVKIGYKSGSGAELKNAYISNLSFECNAGDILTYSAEIITKDVGDIPARAQQHPCSKIITFDQVVVDCFTKQLISSISCSIDNAPQVIYTAGSKALTPYAIRPGMQSITGPLGSYMSDGSSVPSDPEQIVVSVNSEFSLTLKVVYEPSSAQVSSGPFINNITFKGAGNTTGNVWVIS